MKKHRDEFTQVLEQAREQLSGREMDLALYGFIGGIRAVLECSKNGNISCNTVIRVFESAIETQFEQRERYEEREKQAKEL